MGQEPDGPMTLLGEATASRTAHVEPASRTGVARARFRAVTPRLGDGRSAAAGWLRVTWARVGARLTAVSWRRAACFAAPPLPAPSAPVGLAYHVSSTAAGCPTSSPLSASSPRRSAGLRRRGDGAHWVRAGIPRVVSTTRSRPSSARHPLGRGQHFFTLSGVDYRALPRCCRRPRRAPWPRGARRCGVRDAPRPRGIDAHAAARPRLLPPDRTRREEPTCWARRPDAATPSFALGVPATNKLLRKLEEVRLAPGSRRRCGGTTARRSAPSARFRALCQLHLPRPWPIRLRRGQRYYSASRSRATGRGRGEAAVWPGS